MRRKNSKEKERASKAGDEKELNLVEKNVGISTDSKVKGTGSGGTRAAWLRVVTTPLNRVKDKTGFTLNARNPHK